MSDRDRALKLALAGLLHDIGKIEQRAQANPWTSAPVVKHEGQPVHATWSAYFAEHVLPARFKAIGFQAADHHAPADANSVGEVVALADLLSTGERSDRPIEYQTNLPPTRLVTIFNRLGLGGHLPEVTHFLPLTPLTLKESALFPPVAAQLSNAHATAYQKLHHEVEQTMRQDTPDTETFVENLLAALQRVAWCVPSAYYHSVPDVSLYDHSRMAAALAVCLSELDNIHDLLDATRHDYDRELKERGKDSRLSQPVALLVGGDISGVQDFIYTLSSKGAARTLRGRSFYLQLLTEAVLRYVLRELGLPYTNVIYAGGGHFYLLAPLSAASRLPDLRRYVASTLLEHHGSNLYLALDGVQVPADGFRLGQFPSHWGRMHAALARAKQHRYAELGDDLYDEVFIPQAHGGNREDTCSVCGEEGRSVKAWDEETRICALCRSFAEEIGKALPSAAYVALGFHTARSMPRGNAFDVLRAFGMEVAFARSDKEMLTFAEPVDRAVIWALDDCERWPTIQGAPAAHLMRYTVNQVPREDFNDLQEKARGIERLGVLRMDVDNLGDLFKDGFGKSEDSRASLARISTLSFQMSLFFEGWVKRLCEKHGDVIYAVYAGGDDVFLIGPWDHMPDLAREIADDFRRYVGGNRDVHLSGGMAFIHGKYPVYQAADDAHDALEQAKHIDEAKNAFSFLGRAWKWSEFTHVRGKFDRLQAIVGDPNAGGLGGPQAVLQTLRQLARDEADKAKRLKNRPVWGPWMWKGAYQLTRMAERAKSDDLKNELKAIRDELSANNYGEIGQWGAAARWAQLLLRER